SPGDPLERHCRLSSQSHRDGYFDWVALGPFAQFLPSQSRLAQLLLHDPLCFFFRALFSFRPVMMLSHPTTHLGQQLLAKRLLAQAPAPPNPLPFRSQVLSTPLLHLPFKLGSPSRSVFRNLHLSK